MSSIGDYEQNDISVESFAEYKSVNIVRPIIVVFGWIFIAMTVILILSFIVLFWSIKVGLLMILSCIIIISIISVLLNRYKKQAIEIIKKALINEFSI